jgi:hypothetical protein
MPPNYESRLQDLGNARRFLTIIDDYVCPVPLGYWWQADDSVPCAHLNGFRILPPYEANWPPGARLLFPEALTTVAPLYDSFLRLPSNVVQRLAMVLDRLNSARRASSPIDRALELGMAAEYLFLFQPTESSASRSEITHQLSLHAAWFLGMESREERATIFRQAGDLYRCRSDIVHDGKFASSREARKEEILTDGQRLIASAVRKIIESGSFPIWNMLVLGPPQVP